jgi:hypothetical protein
MNLLETYNKNKKKHLLKEVTGTAAAGSFVGGAGDIIDQKFAGPFHPELNDLKKQLEKQVESDIIKRMWVDDITPEFEQDFIDLEWDYEYDETEEIDKSKFINTSGNDQLIDLKINYDKIEDKTEENKKFINDTNNWKSIYDSKKY